MIPISGGKMVQRIIALICVSHFCIFLLSCEKSVFTGYLEERKSENYTLNIESMPTNAAVYLNGKNTGHLTPCTLTWLKREKDTLTLKLNLYSDTTFVTYSMSTSGGKYFIDFQANSKNFGKISCATTPSNAVISLDGKRTNLRTPFTLSKLEPGNHVVGYSYPDHRDDSMKVEVAASKISYANILLEDTTQWVSYNTYNSKVLADMVYSVISDRDNNIWIGSINGLSKFDGKNWFTYTQSNSALRTNVINTLTVDKQNRVWIGTTKGFYVIEKGTLIDYSYNLPDQTIVALAEGKDGTMWAAFQGGVCKLKGSAWQVYAITNSGLKDNYPTCIGVDGNNKVWIGSRTFGLSIFDGTTWSYIPTSSMNIAGLEAGVASITISEGGVVWVGTTRPDYDYGRIVYFKNNSWTLYSQSSLNNNYTRFIKTWKDNVVFATKNGIGILGASNEFKFFRRGNSKLWDLGAYQADVDRKGNIWFATALCGAGKVKKILN
ncbi:MAG: hypothetical protein FD122_330 [Stygiobacter sp.]|nr:MAG: hypothetical protein FD122_330 [Stygiobacter sp.]KAF0216145.1 MAG: hypothetical protein FD178_1343 [Ignavibacteria bacterium]